MDNQVKAVDAKPFPDEIPRFSLSPGRSISPIDVDFLHDLDHKSLLLDNDDEDPECDLDEELCQPLSLHFVSLSDIDAQITPIKASALKAKGLQTIFEGVFLETPPRSGGRTVIPRKKYDPRPGDSSPSSGGSSDDDDHVTPLCESYREEEQRKGQAEDGDGEEEEFAMAKRKGVNRRKSTSQQQETAAAEDLGDLGTGNISSFCNSFQNRLNLIPGQE